MSIDEEKRCRPFEVIGLGQCPVDYLGTIKAYPPPDTKCEFSGLVVEGGGPAATAMVALARWGVSCAFSGIVGDDLFGNVIKASLEQEGVDTGGVLTRKGYDSQFAFIAIEPTAARRTIFWRKPTGPRLEPEELDLEAIKKAKVLHVDGLYPEAALAACKAIRRTGGQVVVDAGTLREGMLDLAHVSDYFVVSETFAMSLMGDNTPLDACQRLAELGPKVVGVTLGARGYVALAEGSVIERPAHPVEALDTTGCGDAFHAGITYGVVNQWDIEKNLDFGAWAAAMVSRKLGGRAGIPTLEQIGQAGY
jgi:ribokinase